MKTMYACLEAGQKPRAFEVEDDAVPFGIGEACPKCGSDRRIVVINHTKDWYRCEKPVPAEYSRRGFKRVPISHDETHRQHDSLPEKWFTLRWNSLTPAPDYHTK